MKEEARGFEALEYYAFPQVLCIPYIGTCTFPQAGNSNLGCLGNTLGWGEGRGGGQDGWRE